MDITDMQGFSNAINQIATKNKISSIKINPDTDQKEDIKEDRYTIEEKDDLTERLFKKFHKALGGATTGVQEIKMEATITNNNGNIGIKPQDGTTITRGNADNSYPEWTGSGIDKDRRRGFKNAENAVYRFFGDEYLLSTGNKAV